MAGSSSSEMLPERLMEEGIAVDCVSYKMVWLIYIYISKVKLLHQRPPVVKSEVVVVYVVVCRLG